MFLLYLIIEIIIAITSIESKRAFAKVKQKRL